MSKAYFTRYLIYTLCLLSDRYVFLNAASMFKGEADLEKYEKARKLKTHIGKIRADYTRDMTSSNKLHAQRATAMYHSNRAF